MIEAFQNINKAFESKVRLGIMAVLISDDLVMVIHPSALLHDIHEVMAVYIDFTEYPD